MSEKSGSLYSRLNTHRKDEEEKYEGFWNGVPVSFKRNFRGHRFTDEECSALCRGERIEVHNIKGKYGTYAVQGCLSSLDMGFYTLFKFDAIDTVPNNPDFKYGMPLFELHSPNEEEEEVVLDDSDLDGIQFEESYESSPVREEDALVNDENTSLESSDEEDLSENAADAALNDDFDIFSDDFDETRLNTNDLSSDGSEEIDDEPDWLDNEDLFSDKAIEEVNQASDTFNEHDDMDFDDEDGLDETYSSVFVVPPDDV